LNEKNLFDLKEDFLSINAKPGDLLMTLMIILISEETNIEQDIIGEFLLGKRKVNKRIDMGLNKVLKTPLGFWTDYQKELNNLLIKKEKENIIIC